MRDPFHDLHHHETGSTSHIRLISEGGGTQARSPEMICIDSLQATHPCATEAQHAVYRPSTVCSTVAPGNALCSIPAEHAADLDRNALPGLMRQRLQLVGVELGPAATLAVREPGKLWHIQDGEHRYVVRRLAARIAVLCASC